LALVFPHTNTRPLNERDEAFPSSVALASTVRLPPALDDHLQFSEFLDCVHGPARFQLCGPYAPRFHVRRLLVCGSTRALALIFLTGSGHDPTALSRASEGGDQGSLFQ
jgi:hypothetical protein